MTRPQRGVRLLVAVLGLAALLAIPASAADPGAAGKRLDEMEQAFDRAIQDARAGKLDPADVRRIEQMKMALLTTFPAPFGGASFKQYYRALECIDDNTSIADTKQGQVRLQVAQERCAQQLIDLLEKDFGQNGAAGAALGQARQLLRTIRSYSGFDRDKLADDNTKVRRGRSALVKLFPAVYGRPFGDFYLSLYDLDYGLGKAYRAAGEAGAGKGKQKQALVQLLTSLRRIVVTLDAQIQAKQLYLYEFAGLHLSFTGPLAPGKPYTVDVEGTACGSDPIKAPWHIELVATDVPGPSRTISFVRTNPTGIVDYRFVSNGADAGTVTVKLLLVAGASPRMELQAESTKGIAVTIDPSRNSLKLTKLDSC